MVTCSSCAKTMPPDRAGHEIAVGWTVVRLETHNQENIEIGYLYICPNCTIKTVSRQTTLTG
jgi:hypothetical protein